MSDFNTSAAPTSETRGLAWRLSIWAGIIGPILYTLVFTLDGAFRPGYSAINVAVSFLLLGSNGWIEIANYIVLGLLLIVFALGFLQWRSAVITAGWRRAITALLVLSGLGFVMAALFLPDPVGDLQLSVHARLHEIAFTLVFLPLGISCLLIGNQFRKIAGWRIHGWYSMITGLPTSLAALGSLSGLFSPALPPSSGGLFERILIIIDFAWLVILASRMLMQERGGLKAPGQ